MAEVIFTLKSDGAGDYSTVTTWEAAQQGTDWVTAQDHPVLECYAGDYGGLNGMLDDSVVFDGWGSNVDNTYYPIIRAAPGNGHGGVRRADGGTGFAWGTTTSTAQVMRSRLVTTIAAYDLELYNGLGATTWRTDNNAGGIIMERCLLYRAPGQSGSHLNPAAAAASFRVENCHFEADNDEVLNLSQAGGSSHTISNCTVIARVAGRAMTRSATLVIKNCVAIGGTNGGFSGTPNAADTNNASGRVDGTPDSSAPGTNPQVDISWTDGVDFVAPSTGDFRPTATGKLKGTGADLSGDFTDDITGGTRDGWDIGAYSESYAGGASFADTNAFTITIAAPGGRKVNVVVGGEFKTAQAHVIVGGEWKEAEASVIVGGAWKDVDT